MTILQLRKLADRTGSRPATVDANGNVTVEPWPCAGWAFEGDPPAETAISTGLVDQAKAEGWITTEGETVEHVPGGPAGNPWAKVHTFVGYTTLTFHMVDGDHRYTVTRNPGKYDNEVAWYYQLAKEG
jgi:hypothetical protein